MVDVEPLSEPRDGVGEVLTTPAELQAYVAAIRQGTGPVAVDAERASGFRYGQRAYLVQLRRAGAGTALIDPIALPDLSPLNQALHEVEWVLHAASQDLACLAELHLTPDHLFDTELAGRLLGRERVGLAAMVEAELGLGLAKEHSAADWSTRPLPQDWLRYAALDVEVLIELREILEAELRAAGKWEWAQQEFEAVRTAPAPPPRLEPWRRTSHITSLREARRLAVVREMWTTRDALARELDVSPGRVLPDRAIIAAATVFPRSQADLGQLKEFRGRATHRRLATWWEPIDRARHLPEEDLPSKRPPRGDGPPAPRSWASRFPEAAERLRAVRATVRTLAAEHGLPQENLLSPDHQRRLAWDPPTPLRRDSVSTELDALGARPWQRDLTAASLTQALADPSSVSEPAPESP